MSAATEIDTDLLGRVARMTALVALLAEVEDVASALRTSVRLGVLSGTSPETVRAHLEDLRALILAPGRTQR